MCTDNAPVFWKTELSDIEEIIKIVKKGIVEKICVSAGNRPVYRLFYGKKNDLKRTANLSSAIGSTDIRCYADKTDSNYRPTIFLVGCIHGGEFEGTSAILNLINIFETGVDFMEVPHPELAESLDNVNWILIPMVNPDGRNHVPFKSLVGKTYEEEKYYNQGVWKDGRISSWPECKRIHPIIDAVSYLGGYYNDDGINMMHDNFFGDKAAETKVVLDTAEEFAPDFSVLLHGATNHIPHILRPAYGMNDTISKVDLFNEKLQIASDEEGAYFNSKREIYRAGSGSFNLSSAMHHLCGEPCVVYESNQGINFTGDDAEHPANVLCLTHEQIYHNHIVLFKELYKFVELK